MYTYGATVTRVVDGDTIHADVDMGFDLRQKMKLRLAGLNTPEVRCPERDRGLPARVFVEAAPPAGSPVVVITHELGQFRRYTPDVYCLSGESDAQEILTGRKHLNQQLLDEGLAERVDHD